MEAQRAGERNAVAIAEEYKAQEQAKQNAVSAARWAGVASVAQAKEDSEKDNTDRIKALTMPARLEEKSWLSNIPYIGVSLDKAFSDIKSIVQNKDSSTQEKTEDLLVWSIWNSAIFQSSMKEQSSRNKFQVLNDTLGDSLRSIADPERNPRTAATRQMFIDGYNAWLGGDGIVEKYKNAWSATLQAVKDGKWNDASLGGKIIARETTELVKGVYQANKMSIEAFVATPLRVVTHDIPEFYNAGKERKEGKDRFWDVLFTSTNLMGDVTGTYGMAKPIGLVDGVNSWLSKSLLGKDLPVIPPKFVPYYLKDFFKGGANRNLINNLVENTYSAPSQMMQLALQRIDLRSIALKQTSSELALLEGSDNLIDLPTDITVFKERAESAIKEAAEQIAKDSLEKGPRISENYPDGLIKYEEFFEEMTKLSKKAKTLISGNKPNQPFDEFKPTYRQSVDAPMELQQEFSQLQKMYGKFSDAPLE